MAITILLMVLGIAVGAVAGYFLRKPDAGYVQKNDELKAELDNSKSELNSYKQEVASHFLKTADLVNNMTDSYRAVHEHLAVGANTLCSDQLGVEQLDIKQTHLLDKAHTVEPEQLEPNVNPTEETEATVEAKAETVEDELLQPPVDAVPESFMASSESKAESNTKTVH